MRKDGGITSGQFEWGNNGSGKQQQMSNARLPWKHCGYEHPLKGELN